MNNKLLYYYFSRGYFKKLKGMIGVERNYIYDDLKEKDDFIFNNYRDKVIRKMIELSKLKLSLRRRRKFNRKYKNRFFTNRILRKFYINILDYRIRNELLLATPILLYLHRRRKFWKIIGKNWEIKNKDKIKNKFIFWRKFRNQRKLIRNFKILPIGRYPTYREAFDLRIRLKKMHFWLVNTTKRQVLNVAKFNRLKYIRNNFKNYIYIKKRRFLKNKFYFLKKRRKFRFKFLKKKKIKLKKIIKFYFNFLKKLISITSVINDKNFYKFYLLKIIKKYIYYLKKAVVFKLFKGNLINSLKELKVKFKFKRRKFRIKRRIKKKLLFFYKLSKYKNKIYKLKVRMVNSNFFITLTDSLNNVIVSKSTGQVSGNRKKKVKLSPYLVTKMMSSILRKLRKLKIKFLYFFVNTKINRHINNVIKMFQDFRYTKILKVFFSKPIAHHFGTRKPKLRRL